MGTTITTKIAEAIKSIPEKKEKLRNAFEALQSFSSSLASFTLQWKDIEDHLSAIETSIDDRFRALQSIEDSAATVTITTTPATPAAAAASVSPRPELKSLCVNMDAKGLRSFISEYRMDLVSIREELALALRCASDPASLVLDAMDGFYPPNSSNSSLSNSKTKRDKKEGELQIHRRTCINLLENLYLVAPDISPSVRERALKLAVEWKRKVPQSGDNALQVLGFLQLIGSYGLVSEFKLDDIMELFVSISRRKQATDLIKSLGLDTDKLPDLIQKLNSKGRQFDAVKFIYAFNIVDKFPPVPLLRSYITEAKKMSNEVRKKGNNSVQAQNDASAKEMGALKSVLRAVEEYKLEAEYPVENLVKRIAQLEHKKVADKKRSATAAAASSHSKTQQKQQQSNKRPRTSPAASAHAIANNALPMIARDPYYPPAIQTLPQLGLADHAPQYIGQAEHAPPYIPYGSVYNHNHGTVLLVHGGGHSPPPPPRSYYDHPSESHAAGASSSLLYDRPVTYHAGYPLSGLPPSSYGSSLYP